MPLWQYNETDRRIQSDDLLFMNCKFCDYRMEERSIKDSWPRIPADIERNHRRTVLNYNKSGYDFQIDDIEIQDVVPQDGVDCFCCPLCGWWSISKFMWVYSYNELWQMYYGAVGSLKHLKPLDICAQVNEVRNYLSLNYQYRFQMHPRKLEEVVASIFKSSGYRTELTNYSNDGGIDVILSDRNEEIIGIQIKRHKNSIRIDQIRSFIGALVLGDITKGIFVTTSRFQSGAYDILSAANNRGIQLNLVDAEKLYDLLRISQISDLNLYPDFSILSDKSLIPNLRFAAEAHMNGLS